MNLAQANPDVLDKLNFPETVNRYADMLGTPVAILRTDDEYEKLKRNIDRFGVVVPVIWNKRTNRVVSGHQRLTVLMNEGVTETDVSVVDLDETAEKQLNIAMNKVTGEWDEVKLKELLDGLGDGI